MYLGLNLSIILEKHDGTLKMKFDTKQYCFWN